MKTPAYVGTIFATEAELARSDRHFDRVHALAVREAEIELAGTVKRTVCGEVRFYLSPTLYATARRTKRGRCWFETRPDGDYAIPCPLNPESGPARAKGGPDHA
jgi:hypothetical protein